MPVQGTYSRSGQRVTVNRMTKDPLLVPRRQLKLMDHQFIFEDLLRSVGTPSGGVIAYEEEVPLFASDQPSEVEEGAEIPTTVGEDGTVKSVRTVKLARALEITREDRDRNKIDKVNRRMDQIKNTFVKEYEQRFHDLIENANIQTFTSTSDWSSGGTTIRNDILSAVELVATASVDAGGNNSNSPLGFQPDTLVIPESVKYDILRNEDFSKHYEGNVADENIRFSGKLPQKILGLNVLVSRHLDTFQADGEKAAYVMQRKEVGGYGDERPMQTTPLYEDKDRETWRSNVVRRTGFFIDQPKAVCKIETVDAA